MMETKRRVLNQSVLPVALVRKLLHRGARSHLARIFSKAHPVEVARLLSLLGWSERMQAFSILLSDCDISHVAVTLSEMDLPDSLALLESLNPKQVAKLLSEMAADDATFLASRLPEPLATQVLALMEAQPAADVRELLEHEERTAGRIMTRDFFALEEDVTVSEAITALQRRSEEFEMVFYVYVVDKRNHLIGVISLKKLLTTPPATQLKRIMAPEVISVKTEADQQEVARIVAEYNLLAIPVVDDEDKLVGIVTVDDIIDVVQEEAAEDLLALAGVAAEERITTSAGRSLRLRAPWLLINLATAFLASYVVSNFEDSIGEFPPLAVLMPIVAGMGGNAATQTVTVIIRGMALGDMTGIGWVIFKAIMVGVGNGLITGIVGALVTTFYYRNLWLGVVLAVAMVLNQVIAGLAGTVIPFGLRRLNIDPAIASSVFVTACTDVGGFFSFLGLATLLMGMIN
jgi:magnesium transporter